MTPPAAAAPAVHRARTAAPPRPRIAPPRPRRISGPARPPVRPPVRQPARPAQQPAQAERGLVLGVLELVGSLSSHRALDRLIRGRIWIALIAFALIGIVVLQLLVLQLNASIGRALVHEAQLQRENAAYSIENSELASGERVESKAARLGMELVPIGALRFLTADPRADVARAAAALGTPVHTSSAGSGEAGASTQGQAASSGSAGAATGQAATEASAPASSEAAASAPAEASSTAATPSAPSSTAGASAAPPSESAPAAPPGGAPPAGAAGGVGATAANGAG